MTFDLTSTEAMSLRPRGAVADVTHLLLVEDDDGDAFLVSELLLDAGSRVQITRSRSVAEAQLELPGSVDCVLLDLGLPDASQLDGLRAVLEAAPHIAVLVLTGLADEHQGTAAVAAGAQDYLVKGTIDGQLLTRAIRYAIERKRADESLRRLYESEARAAENRRLERGLLPQPLLSSHGVRIVTRYRPGRHQSLLGGDFYDVVECADGGLFAVIGDVAGHGPDEAALGVCLRIAWRTLVLAGAAPDTILQAMDAVLVSERGSVEVFATVSMVRVDRQHQIATFWMAGHPMPAIIEGDRVSSVPEDAAGTALGVIDDGEWTGVDVAVSATSMVMLYTDGLIEGYAGTGARARLGERAMHVVLSQLLREHLDHSACADALLREVQSRNGGELTDDVALLLLSWAEEA